MKGNGHLAMVLSLWILGAGLLSAQGPDIERKRWDVRLETTSIEHILLRPESILEDPDRFWKKDGAYKLAGLFHKRNKIAMDNRDYYSRWIEKLKVYAAVPVGEREAQPAFAMLETIRDRIAVFNEKAIPLLESFVPENQLTFETTVNFTTGTWAFSFMTHSKIVTDILSYYFKNDADKIMNSVTHEVYHIGYGYNRYLRREVPLDNGYIYNTILDALQNEGLATYVGYQARAFFPSENERDYVKLENPEIVRQQLEAVNTLFAEAESLSPDSLHARSWRIGVMERGYYTVGAHMARIIDEKLGRDALLETIVQGPLHFVDVYNSAVDREMQVKTFSRPTRLTLLQQMKQALLNEDDPAFDRAVSKLKGQGENRPENTASQLVNMGYGMIYGAAFDKAIDVFTVLVDLYPHDPNGYDCLAEAHLKNGDRAQAIHYYKWALKVNPDFENAAKMLAQIQK